MNYSKALPFFYSVHLHPWPRTEKSHCSPSTPTACLFTSWSRKEIKYRVTNYDHWLLGKEYVKVFFKAKKKLWIFLTVDMSKEKEFKQLSCQPIKKILAKNFYLNIILLLSNPLIFEVRNLNSIERYKILTFSVVEILISPCPPTHRKKHPQVVPSKNFKYFN